jgi:hypothetical protein
MGWRLTALSCENEQAKAREFIGSRACAGRKPGAMRKMQRETEAASENSAGGRDQHCNGEHWLRESVTFVSGAARLSEPMAQAKGKPQSCWKQ